jgi:hypothetical protein
MRLRLWLVLLVVRVLVVLLVLVLMLSLLMVLLLPHMVVMSCLAASADDALTDASSKVPAKPACRHQPQQIVSTNLTS